MTRPTRADDSLIRNSPFLMDLTSRFQPGGSVAINRSIANDPSGYALVPEALREDAAYPRPSFNWPSPSLPHANFFALRDMAILTLRERGYSREARLLSLSLQLMPPPYSQLPALLHHFLDFSPAIEPTPEQKAAVAAAAAAAGILEPISFSARRADAPDNPLAHPKMPLPEEWAWLVASRAVRSPFGKDALAELSPSGALALARLWMSRGEIGPSPLEPDPSRVGDKAWAESAFPLGWCALDRLEQSALVSMPLPFDASVEILSFEIADKSAKGWDPKDLARIAVAHKNAIGMDGEALLSLGAEDFFPSALQALSSKSSADLSADPFCALMARANPDLPPLPRPVWIWLAYGAILPRSADLIEETWLASSSKNASRSERDALTARREKLSLLRAAGVALFSPATASAPAASPAPRAPRRV